MKQVLLIDDSSVFREYVKGKLEAQHVGVEFGLGKIDTLSKMRTILPDLMILDFNANQGFIHDLLEQKKADPNGRDIPVLLLAQKVDKTDIARLSALGVRKIISMPLKIDQLFSSITDVLHVDFKIDSTPCILEARVNDNIIFVEIAQGLNREKIELLKYKIRELIELYGLSHPKILVMMTDLSLSFADGPNLELLMDSIMATPSIKNRNIKILTLDTFVREFIEGNKDCAEMQVVTDLSRAIDSLLSDVYPLEDTPTLISERILTPGNTLKQQESSLEMRFKSELASLESTENVIRIAVVDDDLVIRSVLAKTFQAIHAQVEQFETGESFISSLGGKSYDLVFLDLIMPGLTGFEVLKLLREKSVSTPVIVLSAINQRDAVLNVLSSGVKSYLIKPLKPESVLKKTIEILQAAF